MTHIDGIAKIFLGIDDTRPKLMKYQREDGKVIATDAHVMLVAPETHFETLPDYVAEYPNWKAVIPEHDRSKVVGYLSTEELDRIERITPKRPVYDVCEKCNGDGVYECPCCNQDVDCNQCNGDGSGSLILRNEVDFEKHACRMGESIFNLNKIYKLLFLAQYVGGKIEVIKCNERNKAHIFYIGDMMILVMPMLPYEDKMPENIIPITIH